MIRKIDVSLPAVNAGIDFCVLTSKKAVYPYVDGKRTSEVPTAISYGVALHGNSFSSLDVKVLGPDLIPQISEEDIASASAALKPILVRFQDSVVSLYTINGEMRMSAIASGIEVVNSGTNK